MRDLQAEIEHAIKRSADLTASLAGVMLMHGGTDAERVASTTYLVIATVMASRGVDVTNVCDKHISRLMGDVADLIEQAAERIKAEAN